MNNLFDYATSELSQDAMVCWLLAWADKAYAQNNPEMHAIGIKFLKSMINNAKSQSDVPVHVGSSPTVRIIRQKYGADIIALVNEKYALLIEDKTATNHHTNQLGRYRDSLLGDHEYKSFEKIFIYFKSKYFLPDNKLRQSGFAIYDIEDLRSFLKGVNVNANDVLRYYADYVWSYALEADSCQTLPISQWSWPATEKFYWLINQKMKEQGKEEWEGRYVANPAGGFFGCWGGHVYIPNLMQTYLQIERHIVHPEFSRLLFKISELEDRENRDAIRKRWFECLEQSAKTCGIAVEKTNWRKGETMAVGALVGDARATDANGILDLNQTFATIEKAVATLKGAANCMSNSTRMKHYKK